MDKHPDLDLDKLKPLYEVLDEGLTKHEIHAIIFHLCITHENASKEILGGIVYANHVQDMAFGEFMEMMTSDKKH